MTLDSGHHRREACYAESVKLRRCRMPQLALLVDNELCFDCKACEVACKQENGVAIGVRWIRVISVDPKMVGENLVAKFVSTTCLHCAKPPCLDVCPTGAILKREDGIVIIDPDLCIGCKICVPECPFGAIQINPQTGIAEKCNLCLHRIEKGLRPACVEHCEAGAIFFGEANEICQLIGEERAQRRTSYQQ
jgi:Fe-S-cluster-containing dehydrogenase component